MRTEVFRRAAQWPAGNAKRGRVTWFAAHGLLLALAWAVSPATAHADEAHELFEKEVRPLLVEHCLKCHGPEKQSGGLRLDSRDAILKGGDSGSAIEPGKPAESLIIGAVRHEGDREMPPTGKLKDREIAALVTWVKLGAPWPADTPPLTGVREDRAKQHWAFQPVSQPTVPKVDDANWVRTPIDAFVLAALQRAGLSRSPEADRRTLIRRLFYTLTGLPPSPEEVDAFVANDDPEAYTRLVDRLLDSPHYGEHWARHWLDVARYSDTKGYVYAREERFWVHAWTYRDWVVQALNADMPYDRFLLLQLAADQVEDRRPGDLAAMGFLTLGRRFLGVTRDIVDDRIDVVCRGTMALTVACARCHDHKYDPIPTADYYSLYGVFNSSAERLVPIHEEPIGDEAYRKELEARLEKLNSTMRASRAESSARVRARIADYLQAQTRLDTFPPQGFDQVFSKDDMLPEFVRRWHSYLRRAKNSNDPVFVPWHAYAELSAASFDKAAADVTQRLHAAQKGTVNPIVLAAFASPPASFQDVIDRYAAVFTDIEARWQAHRQAMSSQGQGAENTAKPTSLPDPAAEQLRGVLYGPQAPCEVPHQPIVHTEAYFDSGTCTALWKLQGDVDRWIISAQDSPPYALTLIDRPVPADVRIMRRGNPLNLGEEVPRQFLSLLAGEDRRPFQKGSGRLELAQAIIAPENPLTARVIVNRVWTHHFGNGLVTTPSDFGLRADDPSHPELLDWLASRFVAEGWSLKTLHRGILLSSTFRQSSSGPADPAARALAVKLDPGNRLLWHMTPRRQSFEQLRDSALAAAGELDLTLGGKPVELFAQPYPKRRTLYGLVDRQFLPGALRIFDFANPDLHTPQRSETTVPQQALFFLNHPLALERIRALADVAINASSPEERVRVLFQRTLQRDPTARELAEALELTRSAQSHETPPASLTSADWKYGYGAYDESSQRVTGFSTLPHFTGDAWQGGPKFPDPQLGWVQLTATGGHPGNDRRHACVRRWTAPRSTTIELHSQLVHEPAAGDGIRAFVVSSRAGLLQSAKVHQQSRDINTGPLHVEAGETIDLVVDIGDVLNSDQFLWSATLSETRSVTANAEQTKASGSATAWNSQADFPAAAVAKLTPWEQLAQVLLCTNEFLFID